MNSELIVANLFFVLSLSFISGIVTSHFFKFWFIINFLFSIIFYLKFRNLKITILICLLSFLGSFYYFLREIIILPKIQPPTFIQLYRSFLEEKIKSFLKFPHENLFRGIFLGSRFEDKEVRDQFINSGLIHITAVSGQNLTLMFSIFYEALKYIPLLTKELIFPLSSVLIVFFVLLMGFEGNVLRAGLMGFFVILAKFKLGRIILKRNLLILSLLIFIIASPRLIFEDVGTQLSFLAITGIFYLAPILEKKINFLGNFIFFRKTLSEIIAAQLFTLPLIIYKFGNFNFLSLMANFLVVPILPYLMTLAGIFLFLPFDYFLFLSLPFLDYLFFIAGIFSKTIIYFKLPLSVVILIYVYIVIEAYHIIKNETIDFRFDFA